MRSLIRSYLDFAKGKKKISPWLLLSPLDLVSRATVGLRNFSYNHGILASYEPEIPVISVGNITFGGTNKTPFVEMLALAMKDAGIKPGIISRGYGGSTEEPVVIKNGKASRSMVGDEPLLLSSRLPDVPVAVSRDRLGDVRALADENVELIIADDAFQHRKLGRDVDIVLVDSTCPFGNGLFSPAGVLRESTESLARAHMVVLTKSNQVEESKLHRTRKMIERKVSPDKIFISTLELSHWARWDGGWTPLKPGSQRDMRLIAFSAIGSPSSFWHFLKEQGVNPVECHFFKDHHLFNSDDMENLRERARRSGADGLVCTEKDIHNIPEGSQGDLKLFVPRIRTEIKDMPRFSRVLADSLKPRVVITSNGFGEDSIGALLAEKLAARFKSAEITAFPIVGKGELYRDNSIEVVSNSYVSPTGGVIKYSFGDLWKDLRAGLIKNIFSQQRTWRSLRGRVRTVICVGDVYLLLHALWGQGQVPVLLATAKTVYLTGHWRIEHFILRKRCRKVWSRDPDTAEEIRNSGGNSVFAGNPIMDLICDNKKGENPWPENEGNTRVLLLPGSRHTAYRDMSLLLDTAEKLDSRRQNDFVAVIAPTLELQKILDSSPGWVHLSDGGDYLVRREVRVRLHQGSLVSAASSAHILVGLGGTANQLCAGLGIPVVSVNEKGKQVQKKLLGDAEVLAEKNSDSLAREAARILDSPELYSNMAEAGRKRLGSPGALDNVIDSLLEDYGWRLRDNVFIKIDKAAGNIS